MFEVKAKIWFEIDTKCIIGKGRAELLRKIKELGSLTEAAKSMGMAYSHAWSEIKEIEDAVDSPVIITSRGGKDGGSTYLTEFGKDILKQFDDEMKKLDNYIDNRNRS